MPSKTNILALIKKENITPDKVQLKAIAQLQKIATQFSKHKNTSLNVSDIYRNDLPSKTENTASLFGFLTKRKQIQPISVGRETATIIKGMYIWGEVGRGKTWLMDLFFESLDHRKIQRIHFHAFMQLIHKQLHDLPTQPDSLAIIGKNMSQQYHLICLDEFHVMDIADAVILHGLLRTLFENGVTIITTSNRHPDELYKNGSHRERFLPAIELIKKNLHVFHLNTDIDHRKQRRQIEDIFLIPHTQENNKAIQVKLESLFNHYADLADYSSKPIEILGREIPIVRGSHNIIWFTFDILCRGPRSSSDYLQIAKKYPVVVLSEIPILHEGEEGPARRFLNLIDAFYDQHVHLILSSSVVIKDMYQGDLLQFEFERALSRLHEMQSHSWWANYD